jgi:hypothetical protein
MKIMLRLSLASLYKTMPLAPSYAQSANRLTMPIVSTKRKALPRGVSVINSLAKIPPPNLPRKREGLGKGEHFPICARMSLFVQRKIFPQLACA